jgi:hypothetical protein
VFQASSELALKLFDGRLAGGTFRQAPAGAEVVAQTHVGLAREFPQLENSAWLAWKVTVSRASALGSGMPPSSHTPWPPHVGSRG